MIDAIIAISVMGLIVSIPLSAIITNHLRNNKRMKLQFIEKQIELEQVKMKNYELENKKLQLELEQSKQQLLEYKNED